MSVVGFGKDGGVHGKCFGRIFISKVSKSNVGVVLGFWNHMSVVDRG